MSYRFFASYTQRQKLPNLYTNFCQPELEVVWTPRLSELTELLRSYGRQRQRLGYGIEATILSRSYQSYRVSRIPIILSFLRTLIAVGRYQLPYLVWLCSLRMCCAGENRVPVGPLNIVQSQLKIGWDTFWCLPEGKKKLSARVPLPLPRLPQSAKSAPLREVVHRKTI